MTEINVTEQEQEMVTEAKFKTVKDYIAHLETSEELAVDKEDVLEALKGISNRPGRNGQRRGQLAGVNLEDMTDEQLKRELINAKSVLYKAQQRNAAGETIDKNQARVDAAIAEKEKRTPVKDATADLPEASDVVADVVAEGTAKTDDVYADTTEIEGEI